MFGNGHGCGCANCCTFSCTSGYYTASYCSSGNLRGGYNLLLGERKDSLCRAAERICQSRVRHRMRSKTRFIRGRRLLVNCAIAGLLLLAAASGLAQTCLTSSDMDAATRTALSAAGMRYFSFVAAGDAASLRQNSIPSLAADFSSIESTVKDNQAALAGSKAAARGLFLLGGVGSAALPHIEFLC